MEHVVFFTGRDTAAQFRRTSSLEEAVRVVEHLRNVEGVDDARVYALSEVPLTVKAVYVVEVPGATAPSVPAAEPVAVPAPVAEADPVPAAPVEAAAPVAEPPAEAEPVQAPVEPVAEAPAEPVAEPVVETVADPLADLTVPPLPAEEFAAPEPAASNGASSGPRGLGFFAR